MVSSRGQGWSYLKVCCLSFILDTMVFSGVFSFSSISAIAFASWRFFSSIFLSLTNYNWKTRRKLCNVARWRLRPHEPHREKSRSVLKGLSVADRVNLSASTVWTYVGSSTQLRLFRVIRRLYHYFFEPLFLSPIPITIVVGEYCRK